VVAAVGSEVCFEVEAVSLLGVGEVDSFAILSYSLRILDLAGLCILVSLHAYGLAGSLASSSIRRSSLAPDRKPSDMPNPAITPNGLQSLEITLNFPAQISLNQQSAGIDGVNDFAELLRRKAFRPCVGIDVRLLQYFLRGLRPYTIDVRQRSFDPLISRYINSK
jgi:hypothetical protein